ncbi:MAG: GyrI-like domain-containing protein [Anaerolineae bacterium]|nr:GyrI-like domain-containing protein [Anaerolineae bacterium]
MEPKIIRREAFTVMGVIGHFASAAEDFGPLWEKVFVAFQDRIAALSAGEGYYGVYLDSDHTQPLDYLAGMAVRETLEIPQGLHVRQVPAALYAVFTCSFPKLGATYGRIWDEWLPSSRYTQDTSALGFDYFPPGMASGDPSIKIWLPIKDR